MFYWEKKVYEYVNDKNIFEALKKYVFLILKKNKEFNLTGFDEEKIWLEGIYQSIVILDKFIDKREKINILDIGAGVGFPSIPFYIYLNNKINLTISEPIKKRVNFLNLVIKELNLSNVIVIDQRIEEIDLVESFDYICARAVTSLDKLIEISSKCGKINSKYVFLKSKEAQNELNESKWITEKLSLKDIKINPIDLEDSKTHNIITYTKTSKTPANFPRKWKEIIKKNN